MFLRSSVAIGVLAVCLSTCCARAEESSVPADVLERLAALEAEVESLRARESDVVTESPVEHAAHEVRLPVGEACETALNSPSVSPFPTVRLSGFFQADSAFFLQDERNIAAVGDAPNGSDFRRARLGAKGDVAEDIGYVVEMDFATAGRPSFTDVGMEVRNLPFVGRVRIGHWRVPFGMEVLSSARSLTFLERALPAAFTPFRQIGIGTHRVRDDELGTWSTHVFRYPTDNFGGNLGDSGGFGFATRSTWLPIDEGEHGLLHVGGAYVILDSAENGVRYLSRPELFVVETAAVLLGTGGESVPPFVDTGLVPADLVHQFGAELAGSSGSVFAQSELVVTIVERPDGGNVVFPGAYVHVGWLLTGEHRPYLRSQGVFGRVQPFEPFVPGRGWGAWELAGRWSWIDLDDRDVRGNSLIDLSLGLNWYLNRHAKLQFNYIHAFLDADNGHSHANILAARAQVDF